MWKAFLPLRAQCSAEAIWAELHCSAWHFSRKLVLGEESGKCENVIQFLKGWGILLKNTGETLKTLTSRKNNH